MREICYIVPCNNVRYDKYVKREKPAPEGWHSPTATPRTTHLRRGLAVVSLAILLAGSQAEINFARQESTEEGRSRLLSSIFRNSLPSHHFSHKRIDDDLSRAAFKLYLSRLDFQKRFLLQGDVEMLQTHAARIDDEINSGMIRLPLIAAEVRAERTLFVRESVRDILSRDFDFSKDETLETDPEKRDYSRTEEELRDRWRRILKLQVLRRYLGLEEDDAYETETHPEKTAASPEELQERARDKVRKSYDDFFSRLQRETIKDQYNGYFNAVAQAFDPHTTYLPPAEKENFDISMSGSLEGIGAQLREEDGYIKVVRIIPGSAAYRQGELQVEDVIIKVAEGEGEPVDITDMRIKDAVRLIRGKKGSLVKLTVKKTDGARTLIPIIRDVVQIEETFVKAAVLLDEKSGLTFGYLKLPAFYRDFKRTRHGGTGRNSTDDVRTELEKFKSGEMDGIILDLRNNGGGALTDAVNIAGLFIESGPIVQVKNSRGALTALSDSDSTVSYGGPVVVLVNSFSASASEILAGALQDYGRAVILGGEHTHGKGTVQTLIDLNRSLGHRGKGTYGALGALKVTVQKFYRVTGESTQARGVVPDITLPDRMQHLKMGERHLDLALPWDTVDPASYTKWDGDTIDLKAVKSKSASRVESDQDFIDISLTSKRAGERREKTRQSLSIHDIRKERAEAGQLQESAGSGFHDSGSGGNPDSKRTAKSDEERRALWEKGLLEEPYVEEAMAVLADVVSISSGLATEIAPAGDEL